MTKHLAGFLLFSFILGTTVFASYAVNGAVSFLSSPIAVPAVDGDKKRKKRKKKKRKRCRKSHSRHYKERMLVPPPPPMPVAPVSAEEIESNVDVEVRVIKKK